MSLIDFLLDWCFFIVAVLLIFSRPTLVWTVLVQAVADPLPDVDKVLGGGCTSYYRFKHIYGGAAQVNT